MANSYWTGTRVASGIGNSWATLNGYYLPNVGYPPLTVGYFEWGTTAAFGNIETPGKQNGSSASYWYYTTIYGLVQATTYYFRFVTSAGVGDTYSFTTSRNRYCSPTGSDVSGDGTYDLPWQTISYAVTQCSDNDTLILKDGTYVETTAQVLNGGLTIKAEHDLMAIVSVGTSGLVLWELTTNNRTLRLEGLILEYTASSVKGFASLGTGSGMALEIIRCFCYNTSGANGTPFRIGLGDYNVKIYKSTFRSLNEVFTFTQVSTLDYKDCIFEGNTTCFVNTGSQVINTEDHNCIYNNTGIYSGNFSDTSPDATDILTDPKFNTSNNYLLNPNSPCINAGILISNYVETFLGSAPDMGCGERVGYIYADSVNGSDTTGNGTYDNPFKTIKKSYETMTVEGNFIILKKGTYNLEDGFTFTKSAKIISESGYYKDVIIKPRNLISGNSSNCWIYANTTGKTLQLYDVTIQFDRSYFVPINSNNYYLVQSDGITLDVEFVRVFFLYKNNGQDGKSPTTLGRINGTLNLKSYKCTYRNWKDASGNSGDAIKTGGGGTGSYDVKDNIFENCHNSVLDADLVAEDYNCFYGNSHNPTSIGANSITSDPQFLVALEAEIDTSSPCVDAGVVIPNYVETYGGTAPDMGVAEINVLLCTTEDASKISSTEVQLNGNVSDLGGNASILVWFEYWEDVSAPIVYSTIKQTISATGEASAYLTGLTAGTNYKYEIHASKIDTSGEVLGGEIAFSTLGAILINTESASDLALTTARLNGDLVDSGIGATFLIKVWFEYRALGDSVWLSTTKEQVNTLGLFYFDLTGLIQNTYYEFRTKASRDNGQDEVTGTTKTFITNASIALVTETASDILASSVTLNGAISNLGGQSSIKVWFEYGTTPIFEFSTTKETITSTQDYYKSVTSLSPVTAYAYRLCASKTDDTGVVYGNTNYFITLADLGVTTQDALNVKRTSVTLNGNLDSLGDESSAKVWFEYWKVGDSPTVTSKLIVSVVGNYTMDISGLEEGADYVFEAHTSKTDDTGEVVGDEKYFTTTVDTYYNDKYLESLNIGEDVIDLKYDEEDNCLRGILGDGYLIQVNSGNVFDMEENSTFTVLSKTTPSAFCFDSDNIYVGTSESPCNIIILNKEGEEQSIITPDEDHNEILCMENDTDYIYFGINTSPAMAIQMKKSDKSFVELSLGELTSAVKDLIIVGQYIYVISGSKIYKINKLDMTLVASYDSLQNDLSCLTYDEENKLFYLASDTSPVKVIKFDEVNSIFSIATVVGINNAKTIIMDYVYLYIGCNLGVVKIDTTET